MLDIIFALLSVLAPPKPMAQPVVEVATFPVAVTEDSSMTMEERPEDRANGAQCDGNFCGGKPCSTAADCEAPCDNCINGKCGFWI